MTVYDSREEYYANAFWLQCKSEMIHFRCLGFYKLIIVKRYNFMVQIKFVLPTQKGFKENKLC